MNNTDFVSTGRLQLELTQKYSTNGRQERFRDGRRQQLDTALPAILREIEIQHRVNEWKREQARLKEEEKQRRWEAAMKRARIRIQDRHKAQQLKIQAAAWSEAGMLCQYTDDRNSANNLYRVRPRQNMGIAPEWRDENHKQAAKITRMDLDAQDLDAIRYLNTYESMGSISLALDRSAIAAAQRICLPVPELFDQPVDSMVERIRAFWREVQDIHAENAGKPWPPWTRCASALPGGPEDHHPRNATRFTPSCRPWNASSEINIWREFHQWSDTTSSTPLAGRTQRMMRSCTLLGLSDS